MVGRVAGRMDCLHFDFACEQVELFVRVHLLVAAGNALIQASHHREASERGSPPSVVSCVVPVLVGRQQGRRGFRTQIELG